MPPPRPIKGRFVRSLSGRARLVLVAEGDHVPVPGRKRNVYGDEDSERVAGVVVGFLSRNRVETRDVPRVDGLRDAGFGNPGELVASDEGRGREYANLC